MTDVVLAEDEAGQIRARLLERGIIGIVDVHTHFMPPQIMRKVWAYFDAVGPLTGRPWPIAYRGTEDERLAALRSFGVRLFPSLCYPHKAGMAHWLNAWTAVFAGAHPDCLRSGTFFPEQEPEPEAGELVLHGGDGPAPGRFTGHVHVRGLLDRYPNLTLVVAHMGMPEYEEFLALTDGFPRVHLDTTMAFTRFIEGVHPWPRALQPALADRADRILFGSDYPNIPYPYLEALDAVLDLGMGVEWERAVLHDNAARLLGL